jgi:two-component system, sensor histidine kinase and response regulator
MSKATPSVLQRLEVLEAENTRLRAQCDRLSVGSSEACADHHLNINNALLLSQVLEASGSAYVNWDPEKDEVHYSDSVWSMLGYQKGEFSNTPENSFGLLHPEDRDSIHALFLKCLSTGRGYDAECRVIDADGHPRWIRVQTKVFAKDEQGRAKQMVGAITDIDDLKVLQQEAKLQSQRANWLNRVSSQLFEKGDLTAINWALSELAPLLSANRIYLRLINNKTQKYDLIAEWRELGLSSITDVLDKDEELLMQKSIRKLLNADKIFLSKTNDIDIPGAQRVRRKLCSNVQCGVPLFFRERLQGCLIVTSSGDEVWDGNEVNLVREFAHLVSLVFYRQAMEKELKISQERFSIAMEATQDGLWDINLRDNSIFVSRAYFGMLGYEENELKEDWSDYFRIIHPADKERIAKSIRDFVESDEEALMLEYRMQHKNGSSVWVMSRGKKLDYNERGEAGRVVGVHTDITEFKHALAKLDEARLEAKSASLAKSEFLARMSHEIRTPMNAILGMSHLALDTELSEQQLSYLEHIDDAAKSLLSIIDDILDFAKIEAGKLEIEDQAFDLSELLSRLSNLMAIRAEQKNINLVFDVSPEVPLAVIGDSTRVSQIFINLLSNAIKFTAEGGVYVSVNVDLDSRANSCSLQVKIRDTGVGIGSEKIETLFDPFSQADGSVTRRFGGTGLGLTICKHLIELMNGEVNVQSEVGSGSVFRFSVPLQLQRGWAHTLDFEKKQLIEYGCIGVISACDASVRAFENLVRRYGGRTRAFSSAESYLSWLKRNASTSDGLGFVVFDARDINARMFSNCKYTTREVFPGAKIGLLLGSHDQGFEDAVADETWVCSILRPMTLEKFKQVVIGSEAVAKPKAVDDIGLGALNGMHVLLAEDNLVNQKVAEGILRKKQIKVTIANNGREALQYVQESVEGHFDLVLMDMEMPEMDGYEATKQIRADLRHSTIPIVAMTAHAMKGDREKCLAAGMNEYLTKPIAPMDLYRLLLAFRD